MFLIACASPCLPRRPTSAQPGGAACQPIWPLCVLCWGWLAGEPKGCSLPVYTMYHRSAACRCTTCTTGVQLGSAHQADHSTACNTAYLVSCLEVTLVAELRHLQVRPAALGQLVRMGPHVVESAAVAWSVRAAAVTVCAGALVPPAARCDALQLCRLIGPHQCGQLLWGSAGGWQLGLGCRVVALPSHTYCTRWG